MMYKMHWSNGKSYPRKAILRHFSIEKEFVHLLFSSALFYKRISFELFERVLTMTSTEKETKVPDLSDVSEVAYDQGATELFLAIEETRWRDAFEIAETCPDQIIVWVRSMGTEDTTFGWALWRRLPIHEACRRQPPAWFISLLLSNCPECASAVTQFGKLPLHLAVECGAAPEVVNLLVVAYWDGIIACDQSGRTPMELLDSSELLEQEDHRVVYESLHRCHKAYTGFQQKTQDEMNNLKSKHKATSIAIKKKHDASVKREQEKQEEIRGEVRALESKIDEINESLKARDAKIATFSAEEAKWMERTRELANTVAELKANLKNEKETVQAFVEAVRSRDQTIVTRDKKIETLSNDLRKILLVQERDVADRLIEAERSMRTMVSSQIALQNHLLGQSKELRTLLHEREIPVAAVVERPPPKQEEKAYSQEDMETDYAANAAVAAAVAALHKTSA